MTVCRRLARSSYQYARAVGKAIRDVPSPDAERHAHEECVEDSFLDEIVKSGFADRFVEKEGIRDA